MSLTVALVLAFHVARFPFSDIDVLMSAAVGVLLLVGAITLRRLARRSADPAQFAPAEPVRRPQAEPAGAEPAEAEQVGA